MRSASLLALRVSQSLVLLLLNEMSRVLKTDLVCFSFLALLPNVSHHVRGSLSPTSLFKLLIKVLVPIIIFLETMSRHASLLRNLLRDQI